MTSSVDIEQHVDLPAAFEDRRLWDESLRNGTLSPYFDAQKLRMPDRLLGPIANCSSLDRFPLPPRSSHSSTYRASFVLHAPPSPSQMPTLKTFRGWNDPAPHFVF